MKRSDARTRMATAARPAMVVGFDTRFLSDRYAMAVAEVLAANGIDVWLAQADAPTPWSATPSSTASADGGVMITASHNPPRYNGIKLKAAYGGSASSADTPKRVEAHLRQSGRTASQPKRMDVRRRAWKPDGFDRFDPFPAYDEHIRRIVDFDTIAARQTCASPWIAMYGAGRVYLRELLHEAGCRVTELRGEMNPGFNGIHPEPIARHLGPLIERDAQRDPTTSALATDGDADRIGAVDPTGRFIDPHCIMALAGGISGARPRPARQHRQDGQHHADAQPAGRTLRSADS